MNKTAAVLAMTCTLSILPICAHADYITVGTFEWYDANGNQATHESLGNVSGIGTSSAIVGQGLPGSGPNLLDYTGVSGDGDLPTDFFNIGSIFSFNGDIFFDRPTGNEGFVRGLFLDVSGQQCDDNGLNCTETASGQALLSYDYNGNVPGDPIASADGFCVQVVGGTEQCAWQIELTGQSFDIIGQFGSLSVMDLIPTSPGAFVTLGRDPTMNVIRTVSVPEPGTLSLLGIGLLGLRLARRKAA